MRKILKMAIGRESENREGLTLVESMAIVGAMAAFSSIYTYIVIGAVTSAPMSISLLPQEGAVFWPRDPLSQDLPHTGQGISDEE